MSKTQPNKRRRLSPPEDGARAAVSTDGAPLDNAFSQNASKWNLEQAYEQRPRKHKKAKESTRLPIKTAEGRVEQVIAPLIDDNESESSFGSLEDDTPPTEELDEEPVPEGPKLSPREEILQAKEELARIAALINEDPEEHIAALRTLAQITTSTNFTVTKLGLATQLAVYKDIIPGYRIRPLSEEDLTSKLSKDVRKLRNFEQSIVGGYQKYVKELGRIAGLHIESSSGETSGLVSVAFTCACNLLNEVSHFNFRSELLKILATKLSSKKIDKDTTVCREAMETLFANDEEGNASLEAVALLAKMIKAKHYNVDEGVLNTLLHLRLLSEFGQKGSNRGIDKAEPDANAPLGKKPKQKREFRTKNKRKLMKENKAIEKELEEADAVVSHEQRDQIQAETLKLVFGVYFRILKARTPALMGAVLEGLVKYAHLINQEFFGDLLESLKDLINDAELPEGDEDEDAMEDVTEVPRNVTRESLLCVITAFALLQGQDAAAAASTLHLDLNFFISHLYRTLYPSALDADIELSAKSLHLADPSDSSFKPTTKVNVSTTIVLLLRSLTAVLLPSNARSVPPIRLAAFTKQIMTASLHLPEKSCTAMLGLLGQVARQHKRRVGALWNTEERRGDGVFNATKGEVEGSNPFSATVWEGELLRLHWVPEVRAGIKTLEGLVVDKPGT